MTLRSDRSIYHPLVGEQNYLPAPVPVIVNKNKDEIESIKGKDNIDNDNLCIQPFEEEKI
jgi:hypothetical protein